VRQNVVSIKIVNNYVTVPIIAAEHHWCMLDVYTVYDGDFYIVFNANKCSVIYVAAVLLYMWLTDFYASVIV